jgi:hypothetical protein
MHQLYQDAMAIVMKYGKPDLFLTFTCNPNWPEIQRELKNNQKAADRPDITTRIFRMKLKYLLDLLLKKQVFGKVISNIYVIEFQKR